MCLSIDILVSHATASSGSSSLQQREELRCGGCMFNNADTKKNQNSMLIKPAGVGIIFTNHVGGVVGTKITLFIKSITLISPIPPPRPRQFPRYGLHILSASCPRAFPGEDACALVGNW